MVKLILSSTKGTGARVFPHAGFLGLTPLKVEGLVRTRLDEDKKVLLASDLFVAVRCYEARIGRVGISQTNLLVDYCVPLWNKTSGEQWSELGDGEWPFRMVLPLKVADQGYSTASFQEYRVFWRVEAVLNHIPMTGVGNRLVKTYELPLMRYDAGGPPPVVPGTWTQVSSPKSLTSLRYIVNIPPFSLGPLELLPVSLKLSPSDPSVSIHSIDIAIERRMEFNGSARDVACAEFASTTNLVERPPPPPPPPPSPKSASSSVFSGSSKVNSSVITSVETVGIPRDNKTGLFIKTITLQIPAPKSSSHWAIGETMQTPLITLRFFLRIKVTLSTFETFDLAERELAIVSANESDRRQAMNMARARSRDAVRLPSPPPSPKTLRRPHTSSGPPGTSKTKKSRSSRGMEAAAAATDAATAAAGRFPFRRSSPLPSPPLLSPSSVPEYQQQPRLIPVPPPPRIRDGEGSFSSSLLSPPSWNHHDNGPCTASSFVPSSLPSSSVSPSPSPDHSFISAAFLSLSPSSKGHSPGLESTSSSSTAITTPTISTSTSTTSSFLSTPPPASEHVQAWEGELERIAAQSRRRSIEVLGGSMKEKSKRIKMKIGIGIGIGGGRG